MKKMILTACALFLSISLMQAQDIKDDAQTKIHIEVKDGAEPDIYVDGKKFDFPMELIDKNSIESIDVIKGDKAIEIYNAKNGVVLITTKKSNKKIAKFDKKKVKDKKPLVIIDGEDSDRESLKVLSADDIESITVVKGEQAIEKYKAANGVIIITTKKGKKKKKAF